MLYAIAPFIGWLLSGVTKFALNALRYGTSEARRRMGNGGFPSTHACIMSTTTTMIGWSEGITSPMFGLAVAVTYIVLIDATGLRRHVGYHAAALNKTDSSLKLRESMGHTRIEAVGGLALGALAGSLLYWLTTI
jgi:acid phosphatase family membrane protein YuiD